MAAEKLVGMFIVDLGIVGFSRWRRRMPRLVEAGVLASPHTRAWTFRPYFGGHLAAGLGNVCIIEGIPGATPGVYYSAHQIVDGNVLVPDMPGFQLHLVT